MNNSDKFRNKGELFNEELIKERRRIAYLLLIIIVVALGLGSRYYSKLFPGWVEMYLGDSLWALNVFLMLGFIFKRKSSLWIAIIALSFSFLIEISQLYQAPWIDNIRAYKLGGVILGFGFLWSDLLCYIVGISVGYIFEKEKFFERFLYKTNCTRNI
jgi:hypothetical protein